MILVRLGDTAVAGLTKKLSSVKLERRVRDSFYIS
jgi:hypothetical protein